MQDKQPKLITPATVGVQAKDKPVKRPDGWPELALPVRNVPEPNTVKGIATFDLKRIKKKR